MRYAVTENNVCTNVIEATPGVAAELGAYRVSMDVTIGDVYSPELNAFIRTSPAFDTAHDELGNIIFNEQGYPVMEQVGETRTIMPVIQEENNEDHSN